MILKRETIENRLKELDRILQELRKYQAVTSEALQVDLSQQWIIERGLIAAATIIFDVADHIMAGHFGHYAATYEAALQGLYDHGVLSAALYARIQGLGGLRNILVHRYLDIDSREVWQHYHKGLEVFPQFAREILAWLDNDLPNGGA
jgi:uncharacterized protein YutE (UPF0331/DUF86 family)